MAQFYYYGRDVNGQPVSGNIEQRSSQEVAAYLNHNKIIPIKIQQNKPRAFFSDIVSTHKTQLSDEQLILFARQLFTIYQSGLPINKGLEGLLKSVSDGNQKNILSDIIKKISSGLSLSNAMSYHPKVFNQFFIKMIAVGEVIGHPAKAFEQMAEYLERDLAIKQNIKAAIRYPSFVLLSISVALIAINFFVVPAFRSLFMRFDAELPLATHALLGMSEFFTHYGVLLAILLIFLYFVFRVYRHTSNGLLLIDRLYFELPTVGRILYKAALARLTHSLSSQLQAKLPLNQAIVMSADVVNNTYLKQEVLSVNANIERGDSIYNAFHKSQIFSPLVMQMIYLGEETGSLHRLLDDVSQSYEREIAYDIKRLSSVIEPILILILAVFVGLLALGIFLPLWSLFDLAQ